MPSSARRINRRKPLSLTCLAALLFLGAGCTELTEIMVVIDSDLLIPQELDAVGIKVVYQDHDTSSVVAENTWEVDLNRPNAIKLPASVGLLPGDNPGRPILVVVTGYRAGTRVIDRQARLSFAEGRILLLKMTLLRSCLYKICPDGQTCGEDGCEPIDKDSSKLPEFIPGTILPGVGDARTDVAVDAGVDAAGDTSMPDAPPPDATTPDAPLPDAPPCWWDTSWKRRRKLTFNNQAQTQSLIDFPVLVTIQPSSVMQSSGQDIRFIDQDCSSVLAHEIESWTGAGSHLWVRVPQIDGNSTTDHIWLYYGNASAPDGQNAAQVWSAGYAAVFHLNGDLKDSTTNANHGTNKGSTPTTGQIAGGRAFSFAAAQEVAIGDKNLPLGQTPRTICAWASTVALDAPVKHWFISYGQFTTYGGFFIGRVGEALWCGGVGDDIIASQIFKLNTWGYHCCVVDTGNVVRLYADGQQVAGPETHANWNVNAGEALLGGHINPSQPEHWDGSVDEARIIIGARSADWIRAQHLSMTGALISYGPEEAL